MTEIHWPSPTVVGPSSRERRRVVGRVTRAVRAVSKRDERERHALTLGVVSFLFVHLMFGPLFYEVRQFAVLHVFTVTALGFWLAMSRNLPIEWVAYAAAYLTGGEVLWRMTRVTGPVVIYEYSKYFMGLLMVVALVRRSRFSLKGQLPTLGYFALLLPSTMIPLTDFDFGLAREDISFNLSGPFTLAIAAMFFTQIDPARFSRRRFLLALLAPILSMATAVVWVMLINDVTFTSGSNKITSGNFGPNQVSALLGLGAFAALFCLLEERASRTFRVAMFPLIVWLLIQSALTFSRGGIYGFAGATAVATFCLARTGKKFFGIAVLAGLSYVIADYVVIPALDEFTDGGIARRFQDTNLTGRNTLAESELELFFENPLLGVGPGGAVYNRDADVEGVGAHTEFTRLLAEHGVFGLGSLLLLLSLVLRTLRSNDTAGHKTLVLSCLTWSLLFMTNAGMRLVAPALLVGLAAMTYGEFAAPAAGAARPRYFRQPALPQAARSR